MTTLPKSFRVNLPSDDEVIASFVSSQSSGLALAVRMLIHDFVGRYGSTDALALLSNPSARTMSQQALVQTPDVQMTTSTPEPKKKAFQKTSTKVSEKPEQRIEEKAEKPVPTPAISEPEKKPDPSSTPDIDVVNAGVDDIFGIAY